MSKLTFDAFVNWSFLGVIGGLIFVLFELNTSVNQLSTATALIAKDVASLDVSTKQLDYRLSTIEKQIYVQDVRHRGSGGKSKSRSKN